MRGGFFSNEKSKSGQTSKPPYLWQVNKQACPYPKCNPNFANVFKGQIFCQPQGMRMSKSSTHSCNLVLLRDRLIAFHGCKWCMGLCFWDFVAWGFVSDGKWGFHPDIFKTRPLQTFAKLKEGAEVSGVMLPEGGLFGGLSLLFFLWSILFLAWLSAENWIVYSQLCVLLPVMYFM